MLNPTWGDDPIWRSYLSDGLVQPPTSTWWFLRDGFVCARNPRNQASIGCSTLQIVSEAFVCLMWSFTDSSMINQYFSPPFGEYFFPTTKQAGQNDGIFQCYHTPCEKGNMSTDKGSISEKEAESSSIPRWTSGMEVCATPGEPAERSSGRSPGAGWDWTRIPPVDVGPSSIPMGERDPTSERISIIHPENPWPSGWREQSRRPSGSWWSCSRDTLNITRSFHAGATWVCLGDWNCWPHGPSTSSSQFLGAKRGHEATNSASCVAWPQNGEVRNSASLDLSLRYMGNEKTSFFIRGTVSFQGDLNFFRNSKRKNSRSKKSRSKKWFAQSKMSEFLSCVTNYHWRTLGGVGFSIPTKNLGFD